MDPSILLSLPAELRLRIYEFVVPIIPLTAPPSEYNGLLYSCRVIRNEMEPEILKRMIAFLLERQDNCRKVYPEDLIFREPRNLEELYSLEVSRPHSHSMFSRKDPFMALMYMHFRTLTITTPTTPDSHYYNSSYLDTLSPQYQRNMRWLAHWIYDHKSQDDRPAAHKIVYDWTKARRPQRPDKMGIYESNAYIQQTDLWRMKTWEDKAAGVISGVEFWKMPKQRRRKRRHEE